MRTESTGSYLWAAEIHARTHTHTKRWMFLHCKKKMNWDRESKDTWFTHTHTHTCSSQLSAVLSSVSLPHFYMLDLSPLDFWYSIDLKRTQTHTLPDRPLGLYPYNPVTSSWWGLHTVIIWLDWILFIPQKVSLKSISHFKDELMVQEDTQTEGLTFQIRSFLSDLLSKRSSQNQLIH